MMFRAPMPAVHDICRGSAAVCMVSKVFVNDGSCKAVCLHINHSKSGFVS